MQMSFSPVKTYLEVEFFFLKFLCENIVFIMLILGMLLFYLS